MRRFIASQIPILALGLVLIIVEPGPSFYTLYKNGIVLLFLGIIIVSRYRPYRYCQDQITAEEAADDHGNEPD